MKQKMIEDILREIREFADTDSQSIGRDVLRKCIHNYCDRIVAVAKSATTTPPCKESLQVGNGAKCREALLAIHALLGAYVRYEITAESLCLRAKEAINEALAEPVRNCEVGTAEEQAKRFDVYCHTGGHLCSALDTCSECVIAWTQKPYEEGEAK